PDHTFLESWIDHVPESGATVPVASVAPPAMQALGDTRAMPDVLLEIARRLKRPLSRPFPWKTYRDVLENAFASMPGAEWETVQQQGGWWGEEEVRGANSPAIRSSQPASAAVVFREAQFDGAPGQYPYHFLPYASQAFLDGSVAHLPWLQELPDVLTTAMWSSWVEINPKTAAAHGITQGELVEVASAHGSLRAPALL